MDFRLCNQKVSWIVHNFEIRKIRFKIKGMQISNSICLELIQFLDYASKFGSPARLWLGTEMVVFISDAENAGIVLKSKDCLNKPPSFYKAIRDGLQVDGLFTLESKNIFAWKN